MITLAQCQTWDKTDTLANFKQQFDIPQNTLYLDGNSLGALPKNALSRATEIITQEWGINLIQSWNTSGWWNLPITTGDQVAQLIGAKPNETVITDSTSVNLYKVLVSAVRIQQQKNQNKKVIIAEKDAFPTDLYIIQGFMDLMNEGYELKLIDHPDDLSTTLCPQTAAVVLSHVNYRTGYLYDMAATNDLIHQFDALVIWDLCHSIGAVPIDLNATHSDFAIGCTYKYLNGGPGAPAMLWVHEQHQNSVNQPLSGWWGHAKPFEMAPDYVPSGGIRRYLCGTQPIVSLGLVSCGIEVFLQTDMQKIREKSLKMTDLFIELIEQECAEFNLELITPTDHKNRGSHVSFKHPKGYAAIQALIARNVIGDYREPEVMRFGITPLYLSFEDIWHSVQHIKAVFSNQEWNNPKYHERSQVT